METTFTFTPEPYVSYAINDRKYKATYNDWSIDMIKNHHCTVTIKDIMTKLHVSTYWIRSRIAPNVEYIKITPERLTELGMNPKSLLLYNKIELKEFLKKSAIFTRKTEVIDLAKCKEADKIAYLIDNDAVIAKWDQENRHAYGKRSNRLLNMLDTEYENVNETRRKDYMTVPIAPFDFWDMKLIFASDYPNNETAYRDFFRKGMVKINIFGKAIFVSVDNLDDVIYPLTTPYAKN
ncbi:MAG: hypothetical protein Q4D21_10130 [Phascolarctobacterium sp.]|nr:hypothetical protein [Phascolarctobacterium sp.]